MRQETRAKKVNAMLEAMPDPTDETSRAAGKTHEQACRDYVASLLQRLSHGGTPPHEQELIRRQLDKIRRTHPDWQ